MKVGTTRINAKERSLIQAELRKGTDRSEIARTFGRGESTISRIAAHTRPRRTGDAPSTGATGTYSPVNSKPGMIIFSMEGGVKVTVEGPMNKAKAIVNRILG